MEDDQRSGGPRKCKNAAICMGSVIHEDLRRIVRGLRPAILDQLGLVAATGEMVEDLSHAGTVSIELDAQGAGGSLNTELESNVFRNLQEAISNSLRHASAKQIRVRLRADDNGFNDPSPTTEKDLMPALFFITNIIDMDCSAFANEPPSVAEWLRSRPAPVQEQRFRLGFL